MHAADQDASTFAMRIGKHCNTLLKEHTHANSTWKQNATRLGNSALLLFRKIKVAVLKFK